MLLPTWIEQCRVNLLSGQITEEQIYSPVHPLMLLTASKQGSIFHSRQVKVLILSALVTKSDYAVLISYSVTSLVLPCD